MGYKYKRKTPEEKKVEIEQLTKQLEEGVEEYLQSDRYRGLLQTFSKFHSYSLNNSILIMLQKPESTMIAGYTKWRDDFNRQVLPGEKGIKIYQPVNLKIKVEKEKIDPLTHQKITGPDGQPLKETVEEKRTGFKIGYVFDVSQTEQIKGKEIIDLEMVHELKSDVAGYQQLKDAAIAASPVGVRFEDIAGGAKGYYSLADDVIVIQEDMPEAQTLKTFFHETAHSILHSTAQMDARKADGKEEFSREDREVQAESVAYIVADRYGLDTSEYSFPYVASWAGDTKKILANLSEIKATANTIIDRMDHQLELMQKEKMSMDVTEEKIQTLTDMINQFSYNHDTYEYKDVEEASGTVRQQIEDLVRKDDLEGIKEYLHEMIEENDLPELLQDAEKVLGQISSYESYLKEKNACEVTVEYEDGRILYVQESDEGYDYTLYASTGMELDGGQLDEPKFNLLQATKGIEKIQEINSEVSEVRFEDAREEKFGEGYDDLSRDMHARKLAEEVTGLLKENDPTSFAGQEIYPGAVYDRCFSEIRNGKMDIKNHLEKTTGMDEKIRQKVLDLTSKVEAFAKSRVASEEMSETRKMKM